MRANSAFRQDVSGPSGKGKHPPWKCYHQLIPCNPDTALKSCWTLHEERLESNQAYHMLARHFNEKIKGMLLFLSTPEQTASSAAKRHKHITPELE